MKLHARQEMLNTLQSNPDVSVLIVGAGVNGIGLFRDLALQGVDVLVVDKSDFCAGASAGSSHMVHGGLRYLENAEFRLVREALKERNLLLQNAPHYVKPLPTTIPIFKWFSGFLNAPLKFLRLRDKPGERGALIIKIGLMMYDLFTRGQQTLPRHKFFSRAASLAKRPYLNADIVCTATYYDAWMPYPERICLEMLMDAEAANPQARAFNYLRAASAQGDTVILHDELTGQSYAVKPEVVVNASGPWIDFTNKALNRPTKFIGGTKGAHLVVDNAALYEAAGGHEIFFENNDGRIVLFFPLQDKVLMGTTDIPVEDPETAICTPEEEGYILDMVRKVFPNIKLDSSQIVFRFSGVRPLPASNAATAGQISRDHSIQVVEPGDGLLFPILSLVGGKWTTFRAFAEQTADVVLARLNKSRKLHTDSLAFGGGKAYPRTDAARQQWLAALAEKTKLPIERVETLFERYGTYAETIAAFMVAEADEMLRHHPAYSKREVLYLALYEKIVHLDDLILRRTLMAMLGEVTGPLLDELSMILARALGWTEDERRAQVQRASQLLQQRHGIHPDVLRLSADIQN